MAILSMTGFATKTFTCAVEGGTLSVTISIKALNARFFETTCKLPPSLFNIETAIIRMLKEKLLRGHIYCTVHLSNPALLAPTVVPALRTIENYVKALEVIRQQCAIDQPVNLDHIVRLPAIFESQEQSLPEKTITTILAAISDVAYLVDAERAREGRALLRDFEERVAVLRKELTIIEEEANKLIQQQKEKVQHMVQTTGNIDPEATEARKSALYVLDRMDINEELVRIGSHLESMQAHLASDGNEKGKQLDFMLQELAREINTVAAKCPGVRISAHSITFKVEIEKMREQAQNII